MATFELTTPDGAVYHVDAPDEQSAVQALQQHTGGGDTQAAPQAEKPFSLSDAATSARRGFMRGVRDPIDAGAEMLTHGLASAADFVGWKSAADFMKGQAANVDALDKQAEADYQKTNSGGFGGAGRVAGNLATTFPLAAEIPATLPRALLAGAKQGAVMGALEPVSGNDNGSFWGTKLDQALTGAATGAGTAGALAGASRIISPNTSASVKRLMQAGVKPTSGQILGGSFDRIEEAAQSLPFVGDSIRNARRSAVESFNRAAANEALAPLGVKTTAPEGRELIQDMMDKAQGAYHNLVPHSGMVADSTFANNLANIRANAAIMTPARAQQFESILQNKVIQNFSHGGSLGHMSGPRFKEAESELGRLASDFRHSADADQRQLGSALLEVQTELRDNLARANPGLAGDLAKANDAYANALRVQGAASSTAAEGGLFSPAQFSNSVRNLDPTLRKGAYARGKARMQDLSDAAKEVLGNKVPDSGTPFRQAVQGGGIVGAAGGLHLVDPQIALAVGAGIGGLSGVYSKPGQAVLRSLLASRPAEAARVARILRSLQLPRAVAASSTQPQ